MSSVLSGRAFLPGMLTMLLKLWMRIAKIVRVDEQDPYQVITQLLDECAASMQIWVVESSSDILAHIALWHREMESYRGYLFCSDAAGRTFLLDLRAYTFVEVAKAQLLQIDGVNQAKRFIDALLKRYEEGGDEMPQTFSGGSNKWNQY